MIKIVKRQQQQQVASAAVQTPRTACSSCVNLSGKSPKPLNPAARQQTLGDKAVACHQSENLAPKEIFREKHAAVVVLSNSGSSVLRDRSLAVSVL